MHLKSRFQPIARHRLASFGVCVRVANRDREREVPDASFYSSCGRGSGSNPPGACGSREVYSRKRRGGRVVLQSLHKVYSLGPAPFLSTHRLAATAAGAAACWGAPAHTIVALGTPTGVAVGLLGIHISFQCWRCGCGCGCCLCAS
jgi:hypothetical protein